MSNLEKSKFTAESLTLAINKHSIQFKKSSKKLLKSIKDRMNYHMLTSRMKEAVVESIKAMDEWEEKSSPGTRWINPETIL